VSVPTESGWYWVRLTDRRAQKWEVAHLGSHGNISLSGEDCWLAPDDIAEWGPRIPAPEDLARMTEIYERYVRGVNAAAAAGGLPPSLDYKAPGSF